jgi:ribonuclease G
VAGQLLIAAGPGEWRAAWIEAAAAVELYVERGDIRPVGSIHLGRVVRRSAGLDAAFVEIGEARPGFLPRPGARLDEGARVLVQVRRESQRGKGAALSARIIPHGVDPARLEAIAAALEPPAQLAPAPGFAAALAARLPGRPDRVLTDDPGTLGELRPAFPDAEIRQAGAGDAVLDLDAAFAAALAPSLTLPGGGSLHIEESRAAVVIDVDTGTPEQGSADRAALAVNLAAAAAIARQIRLRQLAGGIIVDFAALAGRGPRERVHQALAAALAGDPAQPRILGWTRLGHLEVVRPRRGRPLGEAMLEPQRRRKSATALAFEALRALYREARAQPAASWRLTVAPAVATALHGPAAAALRDLETRLAREIAVRVAAGDEPPAFDIAAA